jgi:pimeloyl-ACP methyl ester carboxylesterase
MTLVNGVQIHYVIGGHGDPVVLLHGWPETWYEWHKVMYLVIARWGGRCEQTYHTRRV